MQLTGIIAPLVTPFLADGALELSAFEANLDSYAGEDLSGYLVLGSNGEAAALDEPEKLRLVQAARAGCPRERVLLVGTGLESTQATIAFTRRVADLGADAALVLTPHYYRPQMSSEALRRHYQAVADAAPLPVLFYSVPQYTGLSFPVELAAALCAHPRVAGIKESSGDVGLLARLVSATSAGFRVVCGAAPVLYPALCVGASAGILAVACCVPGVAARLYRAFECGDHAAASRLQQALTPLAVLVTTRYGVAGLKLAMDLSGRRGGHVRAPLLASPVSAREELQGALQDLQRALA